MTIICDRCDSEHPCPNGFNCPWPKPGAMDSPDFSDFDVHERPFDLTKLIAVLQNLKRQLPDCYVGRSGNMTGNLCVYDRTGAYIGLVELHDEPELVLWEVSTPE